MKMILRAIFALVMICASVSVASAQGYPTRKENFNTLNMDLHTLSGIGTSTLTAQIPAGALLKWVTFRINTAVSGCTSWDLGVTGDLDRFANDIALTVGTTGKGFDLTTSQPTYYAAATPIRVTCNGGTIAGGVIRFVLYYEMVVPPTY